MDVLLVNQPVPVFGGSETYLLTIAPELERLGHEVWVHAPGDDRAARLAREGGLRVAARDDELPPDPQVVLTQDGVSCALMARRYPGAVRPYVLHGSYLPQMPPQLTGAQHAVITMNDGTERLARALAHHPDVVRLRQPVDLDRFRNRGEPGDELRHVLLLGSEWAIESPNEGRVAEACRRLGLELTRAGVGGSSSDTPEFEIAGADAVVGVGRCIVEAMASHRAAYVFGETGVDGWVDPGNYDALERRGFSGGATRVGIEVDRLCADLRAYRPDMGHDNRSIAIARHSARRHAAELVALFERLDPAPVADPAALEAVARLIRMQRHLTNRLAQVEGEGAWLRSRNRELAVESAERAATLDAVLAGRQYRLAELIGRPIRALRRIRLRG